MPTIVGIDHALSFPLRYFEVQRLVPECADFSDRGRPFRADRGRRFSVIVDGHGRREATWSS